MPQDSLAELPKVSNRYQLLDVVKVDRIWTTYRAQDHVLKREVLLKTVKDLDCLSEAELHRIESQARSAARLSHPKVEAVLDFGSFSGTPYLVSDCLSGQTLRDYIESKEIPNLESAMDVFIQMAEIVEYMHDHKVIHNNLSLDSFLVILDGGQLEIRLTGLDFVGDIDSSHNQDPANTKSRRDKYSDLRALGLIFIKSCCAGRHRRPVSFPGLFAKSTKVT
ncbi:MAG: protein kinase [Cyanobacteriota/Melainabacteria group bacterium]